MSERKPEILAPAGSMEQLVAAVRAGADAVYLGAGSMNARRSARNFSDEELVSAAAYCRERGVKLYVTLNTLVFDDEMEEAQRLFSLVCSLPADGVIVQDIGFADMMRRTCPDMPLCASTQMTVHNPAALKTLRRLGFSRAVVARELSAEEIGEMAKGSPVELEAFVHGALCMSVSGQCYLSAILGGRSGNRGRCAQPCRLPFRAGEHERCLSLKDMSNVGHIGRLAELGIASLKIEGRMKRPEYCAAAVAACRAAAHGKEIPDKLQKSLSAVFSRSGFTDGYFLGKRGIGMFGCRTRDDVAAADSSTLASLHELYKNEYGRVPVDFDIVLRAGEPLTLTASDRDGNSVRAFGAIPESSDGEPVKSEYIERRLVKTGGTPYLVGSVRCDISDGLFVPASAINGVRREALEKLSAQRAAGKPKALSKDDYFPAAHKPQNPPALHAVLSSPGQLPKKLPDGLKRIYLPLECSRELAGISRELAALGVETAVEAPRGLFGREKSVRELMRAAADCGIRRCMIHNIGLLDPAKEAGLIPCGGFGLNITNTRSVTALEKLGMESFEASFELSLQRIAALGGNAARGVIVYGRLPLMLTRNCPAALSGCALSERPEKGCGYRGCSITDRMDVVFPTICRMGCSELLNSVPLNMLDRLGETSADYRMLRFTTESAEAVGKIMLAFSLGNGEPERPLTRGLYYRPVE